MKYYFFFFFRNTHTDLSDPIKKQQLLQICQKYNLEKHVQFQGRVNHKLLSCVFPCADIAVFPSMLTEAYPLVLMVCSLVLFLFLFLSSYIYFISTFI